MGLNHEENNSDKMEMRVNVIGFVMVYGWKLIER